MIRCDGFGGNWQNSPRHRACQGAWICFPKRHKLFLSPADGREDGHRSSDGAAQQKRQQGQIPQSAACSSNSRHPASEHSAPSHTEISRGIDTTNCLRSPGSPVPWGGRAHGVTGARVVRTPGAPELAVRVEFDVHSVQALDIDVELRPEVAPSQRNRNI
jgi:hypothetical protein